jgi:hypothetical protein
MKLDLENKEILIIEGTTLGTITDKLDELVADVNSFLSWKIVFEKKTNETFPHYPEGVMGVRGVGINGDEVYLKHTDKQRTTKMFGDEYEN